MHRAPKGVGIGLRREHYDDILSTRRRVDWLEIVVENFIDYGGFPAAVLAQCAERWPIVSHGVSLSVGGPDPIDRAFLDRLAPFFERIGAAWWSEHLCFSSGRGVAFHDLFPLPFSDEAAEHVIRRLRVVRDHVGLPLLLENITAYAVMPGGTMEEGTFIRTVLEASGDGLLLDVNNVYVNATNAGRDSSAWLRTLPLDRVRQIHLAGYTPAPPPFEGLIFDTHAAPVSEPVWDLYREALSICGPVPTLIEWDSQLPELDVLLDEADRARSIMNEACGGTVAERSAAA